MFTVQVGFRRPPTVLPEKPPVAPGPLSRNLDFLAPCCFASREQWIRSLGLYVAFKVMRKWRWSL